MSWCLTRRGVEHVVLERATVGHEWADARWDTFCLVTPNWQCQLPGWPYRGDDPDGFMLRQEIVDYVRGYAASFDPPVQEGVSVEELTPAPGGGYLLHTSAGTITAEQVVVATGGYHRPVVPAFAGSLPAAVHQLHSQDYRNPAQLPPGDVLVVGTGQSGAQIAEDLHLAGRTVHLAVGPAPRIARTYRGRDVVAWLHDLGHYDMPVEEHRDGEAARLGTNHYVTGRDGGRDIDLRAFARDGMRLYGRLNGVEGGTLRFADDLTANLDAADRVSESAKDLIDRHIAAAGIDAPVEPRYTPVWTPGPDHPTTLDAAAVGSVVWCIGFRADYSWVRVPVFDGRGYPTHHRGVTSVPGFHVLGLPWLHTWGSGRFSGIARDAEFLAEHVAGRSSAGAASGLRRDLALAAAAPAATVG
ncbi:MSMEG_0569 family flavin-dependent oxidoreductase [Modestobacter sp. I12A-02628]|uniref:MSMEG_0569 family flavin-dependent oxidoreductase n=2 Tax=Goekera deserti TaxID=2497753 RepID=A0A7K3W9U7_9ACTN|nr:MSMEG_0569 family flavin-dependent oxidoreductase [Goekera deserti]NDI49579.1 MSMEG_0569 family flavin-dependent oxidoreductase [Goekera deserti]NEL53228.1 MSMEG_0569 family flavin-dependent oxidoreductase [Goekera deserti]